MRINILDSNLDKTGELDVLDSILWIDRYYGEGEFEIISSPSPEFVSKIASGSYLQIQESDHIMIIEYLNIHNDPVDGSTIRVKGRSLESILRRRIVWDPVTITGNFQDAVHQLLNDNAISCANSDRDISRLTFAVSTDPNVTSQTVDNQFYGQTLLEVIYNLCLNRGIGFKITLDGSNNFVFELYSGTDRSYDQSTNPWVVFSPGFENLINGDYVASSQAMKTVTLVAGEEGIGNLRTTVEVPSTGGGTDLARREMFSDASGITRNIPDQPPLTDAEYENKLTQRGYEDLALNSYIQTFDGEVDASKMVYESDYFMGDILQISDEFGNESTSRVTELVRAEDKSGYTIYPTFTTE